MANEIITMAVQRLATRGIHTEADIQSEIQTILAGGDLNPDPPPGFLRRLVPVG